MQLVEALRYKQWCSFLRHCVTSISAVVCGTALQAVVQLVEALRTNSSTVGWGTALQEVVYCLRDCATSSSAVC